MFVRTVRVAVFAIRFSCNRVATQFLILPLSLSGYSRHCSSPVWQPTVGVPRVQCVPEQGSGLVSQWLNVACY